MAFNRNQITHIGEYGSGSKVYMRKNKCGQWNVLILDRKGYRWDMLNYTNYPKTIYGVTQPIVTPVVVNQCQIPPMPEVYKSSVNHLKLVSEENSSTLKMLQD